MSFNPAMSPSFTSLLVSTIAQAMGLYWSLEHVTFQSTLLITVPIPSPQARGGPTMGTAFCLQVTVSGPAVF